VPAPAIAAAVAECSETGASEEGYAWPATWARVAHPRELVQVRDALARLRCVSWELAHSSGSAHDEPSIPMRHLADVFQVACLFWLPIPNATGLPGLQQPHRVPELWLTVPRETSADDLLLGDNVARGRRQSVAISADDRRRHMYIPGQTGTGKSTLILNLAVEDMLAGRGIAVLDPHGELTQAILERVPASRVDDVVLVDPTDREMPVGFNFLECTDEDEQYQVAESFIGLLYQLFDPQRTGIIGPRFEHAARNALLTAMASQGTTLVEVVRVLTDPGFARALLPNVRDPMVRRYWTDQIASTSDFHRSEVLDYIVSKFSPFVHNPLVRNIIGQSESTFSLRQIMDEGKILLVNLAQGRLGQKLSTFLGMVLVPRLLFAAMSRMDMPEHERRDFGVFVDEFQQYATPAFVDVLSGARKYRLNLVMANQHSGQLHEDIRQAIFGNVGTLIAMRAGIQDAVLLAAAMRPSEFEVADYIGLTNFRAIAQVLVNGRRTPCFTLATRSAPASQGTAWAEMVRTQSRQRYGRPRAVVEAAIAERAEF
jgi:hypothetical protein